MRQTGEHAGETISQSRLASGLGRRARGWTRAALCVVALWLAPTSRAVGQSQLAPPSPEELDYGRYLAQECAGCHRLGSSYDGGHYSGVPSITGYPPEELLAKLRDKSNSASAILRDTVGTLDPDQLRLIAHYLSTLPAE